MPTEYGSTVSLSPFIAAEEKRLRAKGWTSSAMKLREIAYRNVTRRRRSR